MADFLEERLSAPIKYGSSWGDEYTVDIVETSGGQEYPVLVHPFPRRRFDVSYLLENNRVYTELCGLYHRAHGKFAAFRIRCEDEYSSNGRIGTPTAFDQPMGLVSAGVYQLRKVYGTDQAPGATGYPYRTIHKPVAGTVKVGIGPTEIRSADWSVVTTTGRVTFAADQSATVTGISKAAQAVISFSAHPYVVGQSIQLSGVVGMTQINGLRALVTAVAGLNVTVAINSTAFSTYTSGGVAHTRPQAGESVTAGFEFDFPVRFNSSLPVGQDYPALRAVEGVELIERINP
nr:DUF2460 domain-containing protein [Dechloromonas sp.]